MSYLASIKPSSISIRYNWDRRTVMQKYEDKITRAQTRSSENLKKKKTTWKMSYQSRKKIMDSAQFLATMAKPRTVQVSAKKYIYNFRCAFITLTLPSQQQHTDTEIKKCLNNFLTVMRTKYGWRNYIWKAELQRNENIHFHILTDSFLSWAIIRYHWNLAINTLGYVDRYREKYENMSLRDYAKSRKITTAKAMSGWMQGVRTKWNSPPTENVQSIQNRAGVSYYIAKYVAKSTANENENNEDAERIENFGRTWARSQSLSRITYITRYCYTSIMQSILKIDAKLESFDVVTYDYCTVLYVNYRKASKKILDWFHSEMSTLADCYNYSLPT